MKKSILIILLLPYLILLYQHLNATDTRDIDQIREAIRASGANWTASDNWVMRLTPDERRALCGGLPDIPQNAQSRLLRLSEAKEIPSKFDWRNNNGNWVTPVKNQGNCGSCWDFSAVAQVESWWKIYYNNPDSMIDLSEQFILSCGNAGSCDGGSAFSALDFIAAEGLPSEACLKYSADDQVSCSDACDNWRDEAVKIPGWGFITLDEPIVQNIKNAIYQHPVSAYLSVYSDLFAYSSGIYEHVSGQFEGGHFILIVGWNDEEQSWLCKNSWSADWGESGYFRIKWGQCDMGTYLPFIWDELTGGPAVAVSPDHLDIALFVGDSTAYDITVSNQSMTALSITPIDFEIPLRSYFHPDSLNSLDKVSWWCGNPGVGGYENSWLQYLDLPALNLTGATEPILSFLGSWMLEDPEVSGPAVYPFDGWDGCNVWISVDNGQNFQVIQPLSPPYNFRSIYSFGHPTCWNMGPYIPGWAGISEGWIPIDMNLSSFKSDSVVIRFAMASDGGYCTLDDASLKGFFVDDIIVSDNGGMIFENHGEDTPAIKKSGFTIGRADWIAIPEGGGVIAPSESILIDMEIKTRNLVPGDYRGRILFSSNDTTLPAAQFLLDMKLKAPDYGIALQKINVPAISIPLYTPIQPSVELINHGINDATDFDLVCSISSQEYCDTTHVQEIISGATEVIKFETFSPGNPGASEAQVSVVNFPHEYHSYDKSIRSSISFSSMVDGFETETGLWTFEGGWGITKIASHWGDKSIHVNGGKIPYSNNMNDAITYKRGFDYREAGHVTLSYWTRYQTEFDKDICYLEISGDSLIWQKLDSLSGIDFVWKQRKVDLPKLDVSKVWIRFRFVSDGQNTNYGVVIDDIEIRSVPVGMENTEAATNLPSTWKLEQNYPNPFNPLTIIKYQLPISSEVELSIYNLLGQKVATLVSAKQPAGYYSVIWDASGLASGVYVCRLDTGDFVQTKKMLLIR
ncbi:MAG: C1 family peptidase [Calditrichia bacterium]